VASTTYLAATAILFIHDELIRQFGGARTLRDERALLAAAARPRATFGGQDLYPGVFEKAAALLESLCQNHPFVDGNKRVAYVAAGLFLQQNGWLLEAEAEDAVTFMLEVASGRHRKDEIRIWIENHAVPYTMARRG
jgi:death-on-curing protein